jgi:hypothetical protein
MDIKTRDYLNRWTLEAESRGDHARTSAVMAREDQTTATTALMVMSGLEGKGRLSAIHRSAVVDQFSHGAILP